jgi:6-phosphogluconolactonase/glucosamine-6-phosphate isomerase/deaminase
MPEPFDPLADILMDGESLPPARPDLPGVVVVRPDADDLLDAAAADLLMQALACVRSFGDFHLALSAGPALERLYSRLMYDPSYRGLPWKRTHLWLVEDAASADGPAPAFDTIRGWIVEHSDIPEEQVHPFPEGEPDAAAKRYQSLIRETLAWREPGHDRLDCVLFELDPAGRVAMQPHRPGDEHGLVSWSRSPEGGGRIGLTPRLLNASRLLSILAVGESASPAVAALAGARAPWALHPVGGELRWYLDRAACPTPSRGDA